MRLNLLFYTPLQLLFKSKEASSGLFLHSGAYKKGIILVFICPALFFQPTGAHKCTFFAIYMPASLFPCGQRAKVPLRTESCENF